MPEPVLLTGATGFVGRAVLAELVSQGIPVHAVARRAAGLNLPGVRWHLADLLDPEARGQLVSDAPAPRMIHCAWYVEHGAFWASAMNAAWLEASDDLARRFLASGGRRIVALGTCAEYARLAEGDGEPWPETRHIAPTSPYGQAKAALHDRLAARCAAIPGASLIWARLFHIYGPGEPAARLVPSLIAALRAGQPAQVRAERLVRDFVSTAHLARCLVGLLDSAADGAVNLGSGTPLALGTLAAIVARLVGRSDLLRLSHTPPEGEPPVMIPDLTRLAAVLGPVKEDPAEGLRRLGR